MENYKKFGSFTMAYSTQADSHFSHFTHEKGSIAYQDIKGIRIFVGDPFCSPEDTQAVIQAFVDESHMANLPLVGMQCGFETAQCFHNLGFDASHMGVETLLQKGWSMKGKNVGRRIRKAAKSELSIMESPWGDDGVLADKAIEISDAWRRTRKTKTPLNLLLREPTFTDAPDERTLFAWLEQELVGYVTFEAMYTNHRCTGWYANINRRDDSRNIAIFDAIMAFALEHFKEEPDFETLSMGLAPIGGRHDNHGLANPFVKQITEINFNYGNDAYNYKGIFQAKKGYWPKSFESNPDQVTVRDTYCITLGRLPMVPVLKAFVAVGLLPEGTAKTLWFAARLTVRGIWQNFLKNSRFSPLPLWRAITPWTPTE